MNNEQPVSTLGYTISLYKRNSRVIGFFRQTAGGFYRAHHYGAGIGYGPLRTAGEAIAWLNQTEREQNEHN